MATRSNHNGEIRQLAHDLNNALYAISSAVEILRRRLPPDDARAAVALEAAQRNVQSATRVARELLALAGHDAQSPHPAVPKKENGLAGLRVLVVEDESLIAMHVEDLVRELGCEVAAVAGSVPRALELVARGGFDLVLLDVQLGDTPAYPVAAALQSRQVPFVFMSGYGDMAEPWRRYPVLLKPFGVEQARMEMERALRL